MSTAHPSRGAPLSGWRALPPRALPWLGVLALLALCLVLKPSAPWLVTWPKDWLLPLADWINVVADIVVGALRPAFRALSAALAVPLDGMRDLLAWLPWPALALMIVALTWGGGGIRLALIAVAALAYVLGTGYWEEAMNTLALVALAVPLSVAAGFLLGVAGWQWPRLRGPLKALLDLMQTVPAFAYLIPLLLLFGFGPVVGLIASAIYATPPMVRNTMLGLDRVPSEITEAALMSGCNRRQSFWQVTLPTATPQLLVGLNQTTMYALSMVIIAAIIGGFQDIGWEVLSSMRKAEFGQSILSGFVIALMAILIDRTTRGFADRSTQGLKGRPARRTIVIALAAAALLAVALRLIWSEGTMIPAGMSGTRASVMNQWIIGLVRDHSDVFTGIKNGVLYALLLPLRLGISGAATPYLWGFTMTPALIALYVAAAGALSLWALMRGAWQAAVACVLVATMLWTGLQAFPWPVFVLTFALIGWQLIGLRMALFIALGFGLILSNGLWPYLVQSLYLTAVAVVISMLIGSAIGLWAATSDTVSRLVRPIADTLQTVPQFVFLIPALMFFKVGEFTALIAIILYAVVPPIRYVEHGLRHVDKDVLEAVTQIGTTPAQRLWQVRLPLAMPVIMLGVNQTIMAALSMLAIAALVGTRDLGQQVYVALGKADAGLGLVAGLAIAFLAITSDRLIHAWIGPGRDNRDDDL